MLKRYCCSTRDEEGLSFVQDSTAFLLVFTSQGHDCRNITTLFICLIHSVLNDGFYETRQESHRKHNACGFVCVAHIKQCRTRTGLYLDSVSPCLGIGLVSGLIHSGLDHDLVSVFVVLSTTPINTIEN